MAKSNYREEFDVLKKECLEKFDAFLDNSNNSLQQVIQEAADLNEKLKEINELYPEVKEKYQEISSAYNELFNTENEEGVSLYDDTMESYNSIINYYNQIDELHTSLFDPEEEETQGEEIPELEVSKLPPEDILQENGKYYKKVLTKPLTLTEKIDNEFERLEQELKKIQADAAKAIQDQTQSFEKERSDATSKYKELSTEIENLLPGAAAAGLASAYHMSKSEVTIAAWNVTFIVSLFAMASLGIWMLHAQINLLGESAFTFNAFQSGFLRLLPIEAPLAFIAWFSARKSGQNLRLKAEYQHKWAVVMTFLGLRKEISNLPEDERKEQLAKLYANTLTAYAYNPSDTLDKNLKATPLAELVDCTDKLKELADSLNKMPKV